MWQPIFEVDWHQSVGDGVCAVISVVLCGVEGVCWLGAVFPLDDWLQGFEYQSLVGGADLSVLGIGVPWCAAWGIHAGLMSVA